MAAEKVHKRYFAQVGAELIEIDPEHVALHRDEGAAFSTSAPVHLYRIKATVGDPDKGGRTYEGFGASWDEADASIEAQLPKEKS